MPRQAGEGVPLFKWFDAILIFSASATGLMMAFISLYRVEQFLNKLGGKKWVNVLMLLILFLGSFGVYLGRFLRWNSWDIITDPFSLVAEISDLLFNPLQNSVAWGITFCYAVFMTLLYLSVKKLGESFTV